MRKGFLILPFWAVLIAVLCTPPARAASETCPATLFFWPEGKSLQVSAYAYQLRALTERSVDATLIADTNQGWFEWNVTDIPLVRRSFQVKVEGFHYMYRVALSPTLTVEFPVGAVVKHAWVASAKTIGESIFGWDARGVYTCKVPDVAKQGIPLDADQVKEPDSPPNHPPAQNPSVATNVPAPFPPANCPTPFSDAKMIHTAQPRYPGGLVGVVGQPLETVLYVAIDATGKLVDTWVLAGAGYSEMDDSALSAARQSKYAPATSYCRPVSGVFVVVEEFVTVLAGVRGSDVSHGIATRLS